MFEPGDRTTLPGIKDYSKNGLADDVGVEAVEKRAGFFAGHRNADIDALVVSVEHRYHDLAEQVNVRSLYSPRSEEMITKPTALVFRSIIYGVLCTPVRMGVRMSEMGDHVAHGGLHRLLVGLESILNTD